MRVRLWAVQSRHSDGPSPAVATQTPASRDHGIAGDFGGQARDGKFLNAVDGTRGLEPVQVKTQKILNFSDFGVNTLVVTNASWVANENHPRWGRACGSGEGTGGGGLCLRVAGVGNRQGSGFLARPCGGASADLLAGGTETGTSRHSQRILPDLRAVSGPIRTHTGQSCRRVPRGAGSGIRSKKSGSLGR